MVLRRLVLENYCQHEHRELVIEGNLIAVVGHNGVGKSNFLGAIQFVLTGEQGGKNKSDLLHWGAKSGYVLLEFEHEGRPGYIKRSCSDNKVTLEYDGITTTGITNVAKEMYERLKFDKELGRQAAFVRQTEIDTIISAKTDRRERELAFQRLLGIDAAKIHKVLTDWIYVKGKPENYDVQLAENQKRLEDLEARLADTMAQVDAAEAERAGAVEADSKEASEVSVMLRTARDLSRARDEIGRLIRDRTSASLRVDELRESLSSLKDPAVDLSMARQALQALTDERAVLLTYAKARESCESAEARLEKCAAEKHPSEDDVKSAEDDAKAASDELAAVRGNLKLLSETVQLMEHAAAGDSCTCPVCRGKLDAGAHEALVAELEECRSSETRLMETYVKKSTMRKAMAEDYRRWELAHHAASTAAEAAREHLKSLPVPSTDLKMVEAGIDSYRRSIADQESYDYKTSSSKVDLASAEAEWSVLDQKIKALGEYIDSTSDKIGGKSEEWLSSRLAELEAQTARVHRLDTAIAVAKASRDEVRRTIDRMRATMAELREAQERQDRLTAAMETLTRVKDWFHYQNGPRQLTNQVLLALTDDVNKFLGNFTAPFVVIPDTEQLGFRVQFTDGRTMPEEPPTTDVLSGGERVQLAVAFRLAIYCMFAGKLGLLSLDEPTAYLDDSNVDRFGLLLQKVKSIAANMNTQVFMATHERSVIPHMDSVIDLNE